MKRTEFPVSNISGVQITATGRAGFFMGIISLRQLLPHIYIILFHR